MAASFLRRQGLRVLVQNYRVRSGEVDLVCRDDRTLVFVEVKSRAPDPLVTGVEAVGHRKRQRLIRAANAYLRELSIPPPPCRYDIVEVTLEPGCLPFCRHVTAAFTVERPEDRR